MAGDTHTAPHGSAVRIAVVGAEQGQRVDNFLLAQLKGLPRSRIYRMVRRGEVRVNGARTQPSRRLQRGDAVRIPPYRPATAPGGAGFPAGAAPARLAALLRERVLYEDARLLVLDKPSGLAVHGGSGVSLGVVEALRLADPSVRFELAHRLDRDTSGCLLVAKHRAALLQLHEQFRIGKVDKRYQLLVCGCWPRRRTVAEPLERFALASGERRVRASANGEPARTDFAVCRRAEDATWLAATPHTGRTHQIRVHAALAGHPILGDDKYGASDAPPAPRLMLHGTAVECELDGVTRRFEAPLPAAFADWWGNRSDATAAD